MIDPTPGTAPRGRPAVLFVCVGNAGKSQMAAALMRRLAGNQVEIHSAGTDPKPELNALSVESLEEMGASTAGEHPKPIDPELLARMDVVITIGSEAKVDQVPGPVFEAWVTDEPSVPGVDGMERMRLVREDIAARVDGLAERLGVSPT